MKLGSLKQGGRDGTLVVVSRDLTRQRRVPEIAATLRSAIDEWARAAPRLAEVAADIEAGRGSDEPFDHALMAAPLPRAHHWAAGSAYVNYLELVSKAVGPRLTATMWADPLIYQGGSDTLLGPRDDILAESTDWGIDFEAEFAVITDDVAMGIPAEEAKTHIILFMLVNDISLRGLAAAEQAKGYGFYQSKPPSAFSPVAVTADELGAAWDGQKLHLPIVTTLNGKPFGRPDTGRDMAFDLPTVIAHAAKTRRLGVGTIVGSGVVSNRVEDGAPGRIEDGGVGYSSLAELRMTETIAHGAPRTPFLAFGDRVRIEMVDPSGASIFGAIDQRVRRYTVPA
jgi:fumarylacetoacetate (FAA) hydrolase